MTDELLGRLRFFLKDTIRQHTDFSRTRQSLGVPPPPIQKPPPPGAVLIELPKPGQWSGIAGSDLEGAIAGRKSRRVYRKEALTLDEVSFLLWATQGVREKPEGGSVTRTVPSAGCRHAFETYLAVFAVHGLEPGIYRYLPLEHAVVLEFTENNLGRDLAAAALGQRFVSRGALTFIWAALPARMEWRYGTAAHKVIAVDAGHVCQNLYLVCEAIGAGTCAVAAYDQEALDALLRLDGEEEFAIYLAPVGKIDR